MKFKKFVKLSLAVALVFGTASTIVGCGKKEEPTTQKTEEEKIYDLYVSYMSVQGETPLTYEEWYSTLKGAKGDKGDPGQAGAKGDPGVKGDPGKDGATWHYGTATTPSQTLGAIGDFYFNTSTQTIYIKNATGWVEQLTIEDGENAVAPQVRINPTSKEWEISIDGGTTWTSTNVVAQGKDGENGENGKDAIAPQIRINETTNEWEVSTDGGKSWQTTGVKATGAQGAEGEKGETGATGADGQNGKDGQNGQDGKDGATWYTGEGTPEEAEIVGSQGDLYLDTETSNIYKKGETSWELITNIKGETGTQGAEGEKGETGATGADGENGKDGQNGQDGEDGKDGVSVVNITTSSDKWGITVTFTYTMSDESTMTSSYTVVDPFKVYAAYNEEDINALISYGVSTIRLADDIELETAIVVDKEVTIELNNKNISIPNDTVGDGVFHVVEGGNLTIEGEGVVNGASKYNDYGMVVWADGGNVTINGGTFTNVGTKSYEDDEVTINNNEVIYVKNGSVVTINDGLFIGNNSKWVLNSHDTDTGTFVVKGGHFVDFDPSNTDTEPEGKNNNFVAEGYYVYYDGYYYVVSEEYNGGYEEPLVGKAISCEEDILDAIKENISSIYLINNLQLENAIVINTTLTINLNGYSISIPNDTVGDGVFHVVEGGNLTIEGEGVVNGASKYNDYGMVVWADGGNVTINGGTFTNVGTKSYEDDEVTINNNEVIYVKNGSVVTINDGLFIGNNSKWVLNSHDTDTGTFVVRGGVFIDFDPSNTDTEREGVNNNFVEEGYTAVKAYDGESNIVGYVVISNSEFTVPVEYKEGEHIVMELISVTGEYTDAVVASGTATVIIEEGYYNGGIGDGNTAVWAKENGKVIINGGYFTVSGIDAVSAYNDVIYAKDDAQVEIYGGFFEGPARDSDGQRFLLNLKDNCNAKITVYGGTFVNFDPSNTGTEPEGVNDNFVAEGYTVVAETKSNGDVWYTVVSNN